MKTITVNIKKQTVTMDNERCNFYEAGLVPNGITLTDEDDIEEHFKDRYYEEEIEVEFVE
jgi:hypothetical protein